MNIKKIIAGMLVVVGMVGLGLSFSSSASANNGKGENENEGNHMGQMLEAHQKGSTLEVHINDNGTVLVRGAKVVSVSGNVINASTVWGTSSMSWQVLTNASTRYVNRMGQNNSLAGIAAGDVVSFSGSLTSGSGGVFAVTASSVKNWSSSLVPVNTKTTVEGKVTSAALGAVPTSFTLTMDGKVYTVRVASDTAVINNLWLRTGVASLRVGDDVRVYGMVNSDLSIDATVVRDVSLK